MGGSLDNRRLWHWLLKGWLNYGILCGVVVAFLTDKINTQDFGFVKLAYTDVIILCAFLVVQYGSMGMILGLFGCGIYKTTHLFIKWDLADEISWAFFWPWPIIILLSLPDVALLPPRPYLFFWHALLIPAQIGILALGTLCFIGCAYIGKRYFLKVFELFLIKRPLRATALYLVLGLGFISLAHLYLSSFLMADRAKMPYTPKALVTNGSKKVVMLGIDGLEHRLVARLVAQDLLPNFKYILKHGITIPLHSPYPGVSPKKWPVISTGFPSSATGVHYFNTYRLPGFKSSFQRMPLETLTSLYSLRFLNYLFDVISPLRCEANLQVPPVWRIASEYGKSVQMHCWPNSVPCGKENDKIISTCSLENDPGAPMYQRFAGAFNAPGFKEEIAKVFTVQKKVLNGLLAERDLILSYLYSFDHTSHQFCGSYGATGPVVEILKALDTVLGEIINALPSDTALIIVSDHGFDYDICTHIQGIDAVTYIYGAGLESNLELNNKKGTLQDIFPTVLNLLDIEIPKENV